ncbi:hypothetical protein Hanom_Chr12g01078501 [Helianthus anomalus]
MLSDWVLVVLELTPATMPITAAISRIEAKTAMKIFFLLTESETPEKSCLIIALMCGGAKNEWIRVLLNSNLLPFMDMFTCACYSHVFLLGPYYNWSY